ncbi:MAG TPA: amino acid permease [Blastocatellia bacterium]|nr:amino acid permease [Blastocatellia bacterium]
MRGSLFAKKPLERLLAEMEGENRLRRVLGPLQLSALGIGATIGAGIFVATGVAAHDTAGPALVLSYVAAGVACVFAAMCYSEFASMVPVAGSAYTYAYATLGEVFAWIIGWDLVLEYAVSTATVTHGVSAYFQDLLGIFGLHIPKVMSAAPVIYNQATGVWRSTGTWFDLTAVFVTCVAAIILIKGIKESASFNTAIVIVKVVIVLFVIVVGAFYVKRSNWTPFSPYGLTGINFFGKMVLGRAVGSQPVGMLAGAAIIFFAYIGFDSVSTHAEEAKNPRRDVPIGIIASLILCTALYMGVTSVLTGMVPYNKLDINAPVADAFKQAGLSWAELLISAGAVCGITSVVLVTMLSQARILLAMSRDGLIPEFFGAVHSRWRTPWKATVITALFVATTAALLPIDVLLNLVNIGTLMAFALVCAAVLIMRRTHPNAHRPFRAPLVPLVPVLGIASCLVLMFSLPVVNWLRLVVWLAIGLTIYFGYGRRHSRLANGTQSLVEVKKAETVIARGD